MTKRFKNVIEGNFVLFYYGDEQIPFDEVVGVLNSLNDENEQLKKELNKIKVVNEILSMDFANSEHELYKENEQLKKELEMFKPVMFQDMRKGTVILYRKGDVE